MFYGGRIDQSRSQIYLRRREFRIQTFFENKLQAFITKKKAPKTSYFSDGEIVKEHYKAKMLSMLPFLKDIRRLKLEMFGNADFFLTRGFDKKTKWLPFLHQKDVISEPKPE
jgi:hypothetical protein